jgi:shikimate kinase
MKLSKSQFEHELSNPANRKFNLIIFGMSGSGKTHWSRLLSKRYGYPHVEFDELIGASAELTDLIRGIPGKDAAEKMANHFGMPWSEGFQAKEGKYLIIEKKAMSRKLPRGSIFDLTGSCIYHPDEMEAIRATGLMVYLETNPEKQKEMLEIFLAHPKPVCWKGVFERRDNETNEQALSRCYPLLLAHRSKLYAQFADVALPYPVHKNLKSADDFAQEIKKQLPLHL